MNTTTLGTVGALAAFAGTILAMSSGTKLAGIVLLATALTMGTVGLAHSRTLARGQRHHLHGRPSQSSRHGRVPALAIGFALAGIGFNSIPAVQAELKEIEAHEYTQEELLEMQRDFQRGSDLGRRLYVTEGASRSNPLPLGSTVRLGGWAITVHSPTDIQADYSGAAPEKPYELTEQGDVMRVKAGFRTRYVALR